MWALIVKLSVILLVLFFFLSGVKIGVKPFTFKLEEPLHGLGWVLVVLGCFVLTFGAYKRGAKDSIEKISPRLKDLEKKATTVLQQQAEIEGHMFGGPGFPFGMNDDDDTGFSNKKL